MKKFFKKILLFLPLMLFVIFTNYFIDPANLFNHDYEEGVAQILIENKNVGNLSNYDNRLVQKFYITSLDDSKDTIVLGSSRTLQINSKIMNCDNFFNNSVVGASLQDHMAIYQIYKENNVLPNTIIFGIDPWIFNLNNTNHLNRWKSISDYYFNLEKSIGYSKPSENKFNYDKYLELISLKYFQESLNNLNQNNDNYFATNTTKSNSNIKLKDGSLSYREEYREADIDQVSGKATSYISNDVYGLTNFDKLDDDYIDKFEKFIILMQSDGVEVVFFIPPYYPSVYDYLINSDKYSIIIDVENYICDFANENNIEVYGSYNPVNKKQYYVLTEYNFYDGMHPKPSAIEIVFEQYKSSLN